MIGLTQQDFLKLVIYKESLKNNFYPKEIYQILITDYPGKEHKKDYIYKTCRKMATIDKTLTRLSHEDGRKTYYAITAKGKEEYQELIRKYKPKFKAVKTVIDRIVYDVTGNGEKVESKEELIEDYRIFLSKLLSVKDVVRYVTLKELERHTVHTMAEVGEIMKNRYGWTPSNSYLYDIAHEMEENNLVIGRWKGERRTIRILRLTEEGRYHFKQIANSLREKSLEIQRFLQHVLLLFPE